MSDSHDTTGHLPESAAEGGGHGHAPAVAAEDPFANPGLPPHEPRRTDIDPRAEKRAERQVSLLFLISMVATVGFCVSYAAIPPDKIVDIWPFGSVSAMNFALGCTMAVALFCIGAGAIHWARTLMSDEEQVDHRHPMASTTQERAEAIEKFNVGVQESGFKRRSLIRRTLFGALALAPISGLFLLRDLGPLPETKLRNTMWADPNSRLLINQNTDEPLRPEDITVGAVAYAKPKGLNEQDGKSGPADPNYLEDLVKAAILLVRLDPQDIKSAKQKDAGYEGIVAFSKICTHVGCPLGLYEQQTHHMLCPCHQSTFDLSDGGKVVFGPAARPLPQLPITVNSDGFLIARGDFPEPVGPSFWERG